MKIVIKKFGPWGGPLCLIKRPGVLQSPNIKRLLKPFHPNKEMMGNDSELRDPYKKNHMK
jgi:hypothetical protein